MPIIPTQIPSLHKSSVRVCYFFNDHGGNFIQDYGHLAG